MPAYESALHDTRHSRCNARVTASEEFSRSPEGLALVPAFPGAESEGRERKEERGGREREIERKSAHMYHAEMEKSRSVFGVELGGEHIYTHIRTQARVSFFSRPSFPFVHPLPSCV